MKKKDVEYGYVIAKKNDVIYSCGGNDGSTTYLPDALIYNSEDSAKMAIEDNNYGAYDNKEEWETRKVEMSWALAD